MAARMETDLIALLREAVPETQGAKALPLNLTVFRLRYVPPDPKLVDLSFAGRRPKGHPSLFAIAAAHAGDPVTLFHNGNRWQVHDARGRTLARLSRAFITPEGTAFLRGEVAAVLCWRIKDGNKTIGHLRRRDDWEVVMPELVVESDA